MENVALFFVAVFWAGVAVSAYVTLRRGQAVIRRKVERTGHPISDAEMYTHMAWYAIKSLLWPFNLAAWLLLGRPEPGSYAKVPSTPGPA